MTEVKLILLSICLLITTGNGNFVYAILAAFGWAYLSFFYKFYQLFLKD